MPNKALSRGMLTILNTLYHLTFDLAFLFHLIELIATHTEPEKHRIRDWDIYLFIHISSLVNFNISYKKRIENISTKWKNSHTQEHLVSIISKFKEGFERGIFLYLFMYIFLTFSIFLKENSCLYQVVELPHLRALVVM